MRFDCTSIFIREVLQNVQSNREMRMLSYFSAFGIHEMTFPSFWDFCRFLHVPRVCAPFGFQPISELSVKAG